MNICPDWCPDNYVWFNIRYPILVLFGMESDMLLLIVNSISSINPHNYGDICDPLFLSSCVIICTEMMTMVNYYYVNASSHAVKDLPFLLRRSQGGAAGRRPGFDSKQRASPRRVLSACPNDAGRV